MNNSFTRIAQVVSRIVGSPWVFMAALLSVLIWAASGAFFSFSDTWQLIINTSTTIITFLMVFLIQNTQNRDGAALQAKLDELIRVSEGKNSFIGIEHLSDEEVEEIRRKCEEQVEVRRRRRTTRVESLDEISVAAGGAQMNR